MPQQSYDRFDTAGSAQVRRPSVLAALSFHLTPGPGKPDDTPGHHPPPGKPIPEPVKEPPGKPGPGVPDPPPIDDPRPPKPGKKVQG